MQIMLSKKPTDAAYPRPLTRQKTRLSIYCRLLICFLCCYSASLFADQATIKEVKIYSQKDNEIFRVDVTISHSDEGWNHYANRWDIFDETGKLLGTRVLHHPHVNEQPFTRSLSVAIPPEVKVITIVSSDSVHKENPDTFQLAIPGRNN